jgi:hypothetical protein
MNSKSNLDNGTRVAIRPDVNSFIINPDRWSVNSSTRGGHATVGFAVANRSPT